eukprot:5558864-Amphidinium_carterae.1
MVKAVPGFLQVSDLWRWVIGNAVALFSGLAVCAHFAFNALCNAQQQIQQDEPTRRYILHSISCKWLDNTCGAPFSLYGCIVAGLLTGFGLDFLAEQLSGPTVDRATLQLVG